MSMTYILGTAGHVDHGKTSLITALTGIETMHLPEEKRRGMTIELGFAALEDSVLGTIGIVDVPGHERFIRNMVAGTWGLDAALLVVAADDGWMQMSTDHLRVLKAMRVTSILLVMTKVDLVDNDMRELLRQDINIQCIKILGHPLEIVEVSSVTGEGIDELKKKISEVLASSKRRIAHTAFLYIDRVFTLKGIGLTVTGTLRGGALTQGDTLALYPGNVSCRIKNIQSHHKDVTSISNNARTALNLKMNDKIEVKRGMLLAKNSETPILEGSELLIRVDEFFYPDGQVNTFKNHTELEIALGSTHAIGTLHLNSFDHSLGRLSLHEKLACAWNQNAVLIRHGGSSILAACRVLFCFDKYHRATFKKAFELYKHTEFSSWQSYQFKLLGYVEHSTVNIKDINADVNTLIKTPSFYISRELFNECEKKIFRIAEKSQVGFTPEEFDIAVPVKLRLEILNALCEKGKIEKKEHRFILKGKSGNSLSEQSKKILDMALKAGTNGIEIDKIQIPQIKKEVRDLVLLHKLILLENFLYYHRDVYDTVCKKILEGKKAGDILTIAETRERTGLSRKYFIPILNLLEKEKKVLRKENDRIIL